MSERKTIVVYGPADTRKEELAELLKARGEVDLVFTEMLPAHLGNYRTLVLIEKLTPKYFDNADEVMHIDQAKLHYQALEVDYPVGEWREDVRTGATFLSYQGWIDAHLDTGNRPKVT